jgi:hypothetical protein
MAMAVAALTAAWLAAAELPPAVIDAFDRYVEATEARMLRARDAGGLLWLDSLDPQRRAALDARLQRGEIVTESLRSAADGKPLEIPSSLFLHSIGAVFLRGATLTQVVDILQDYDHHAEIFRPTVRRSRIISREGDRFIVFRQLYARKIVTFVYDAEFDVQYTTLSPRQVDCRSAATRGAQVVDVGKPTEREKPIRGRPDRQWRFRTYCRVEERGSGSYLEYETLFVSPELPFFVRVVGGSIVRAFPAEAATELLTEMRARLSH